MKFSCDGAMVDQLVLERLGKAGVEYQLVSHQPVYTCEDAARETDTKASVHVKAMLVLDAENHPALALLPGDKRLSLRRMAKAIGISSVRLATKEEVRNILHVEPGAVSALIAENIPMLLDVEILRNKLVYMSAGTHTESIVMNPRDFHRFTKAKLTSISE